MNERAQTHSALSPGVQLRRLATLSGSRTAEFRRREDSISTSNHGRDGQHDCELRDWYLEDSGIAPATIGDPKNGRGEFFDQEPFNDRAILVRFVILGITPNSCRFEQTFSGDGGKTWEDELDRARYTGKRRI
jgi:hypothetical protein